MSRSLRSKWDIACAIKVTNPTPYNPCIGLPMGQIPFDTMAKPKITQAIAPNPRPEVVIRQMPIPNNINAKPEPMAANLKHRVGNPPTENNSLPCWEIELYSGAKNPPIVSQKRNHGKGNAPASSKYLLSRGIVNVILLEVGMYRLRCDAI